MFTLKTEQSTQDCDFSCWIMLLKENFLIRRLIILKIDFSMILCGLSKVPASVTYILVSHYLDPSGFVMCNMLKKSHPSILEIGKHTLWS